jgi:hypothetical protein
MTTKRLTKAELRDKLFRPLREKEVILEGIGTVTVRELSAASAIKISEAKSDTERALIGVVESIYIDGDKLFNSVEELSQLPIETLTVLSEAIKELEEVNKKN